MPENWANLASVHTRGPCWEVGSSADPDMQEITGDTGPETSRGPRRTAGRPQHSQHCQMMKIKQFSREFDVFIPGKTTHGWGEYSTAQAVAQSPQGGLGKTGFYGELEAATLEGQDGLEGGRFPPKAGRSWLRGYTKRQQGGRMRVL